MGANAQARGNSGVAIGGDDVDAIVNATYTATIGGVQTTDTGGNLFKAMTGGNNAIRQGVYIAPTAGDASIALGQQASAGGRTTLPNELGTFVPTGAFDIAVGTQARAAGFSSTAIGTAAMATGDTSNAFGGYARATGLNSIAVGTSTIANNEYTLAIGSGGTTEATFTQATGKGATAVGGNATAGAKASGDNSFALGGESQALAENAFAIGVRALADKKAAMAVGVDSDATGLSSTAIGEASQATKDNATALGATANATGLRSSALGALAKAESDDSLALGSSALARGVEAAAVGTRAQATGTNAVAVGTDAKATDNSATAVGNGAIASAIGSTSQGAGATATAIGAIAFGRSVASGGNSIAQGANALATATNAIAIGTGSQATAAGAIAIGVNNKVSADPSGALGSGNTLAGSDVYAVGNNNNFTATNSFVIGHNVTAVADNSVVLGTNSASMAASPTPTGTIAGQTYNYAGAAPVGVVSMGAAGAERQIQNVAAGQVSATSTDAINGSQLYATNTAVDVLDGQVKTLGDTTAAGMGGGSTYDPVTGALVTNLNVNGTQYDNVNDALQAAGQGWNVTANGGTPDTILPGETVDFADGSNTTVTYDAATNQLQVGVVDNPEFTSVTTGGTVMNDNGVTIAGGPSMTVVGIDAGGSPITNMAPGVNGTDAVNVDQLKAVDATANKGWNVTTGATGSGVANGTSVANVAPGATHQIMAGDNIVTTQNGTEVQVALNPDLDVTSVTVGDTVINNAGLTINGGPSITNVGIDAGNTVITNVAAGTNSTDAVNVSQLDQAKGDLTTLGMNFTGNDATAGVVHRDLGQTLAIQGVATTAGTYSGGNIKTVTDPTTGAINVQIADSPKFGNVTINDGGSGRITGVAAGVVGTDAVNVDQLKAVDETASKGWNISAQGANQTNVKPGDSVDMNNADGNIVVSKGADSNNITFDLNKDLDLGADGSLSIGDTVMNNGGVAVGDVVVLGTTGLVITGGPSITTAGIDAGGQGITNVAAGVNDTDAVNVSQLNDAIGGVSQSHYYSVNDGGTQQGNYNNDGATGIGAMAAGTNASASGTDSTAVGNGATASTDNSVALGAGSTTGAVVGTASGTIAGTTYQYAGGDPTGTVSVGSIGAERTITNVAAGRVSADSTDAVNGSQLYATNQAIETLDGRVTDIQGDVTNLTNTVNNITGDITNVQNGADGMFQVSQEGSIAKPTPTGANSSAGGNGAVASGDNSLAVGNQAVASGDNSTAIGQGAKATHDNSVALGQGSATTVGTQTGYDGAYVGTSNSTGEVNVGGRQITGVAAGSAPTDAVNVSQLQGGVNYAINTSNAYTDLQIGKVYDDFLEANSELRRDMYAGVASALAVKQAPWVAGKTTYYAGVAGYKDQGAVGLSLRRTADSGRWSLEGGFTNNRDGNGAYIGVSGVLGGD